MRKGPKKFSGVGVAHPRAGSWWFDPIEVDVIGSDDAPCVLRAQMKDSAFEVVLKPAIATDQVTLGFDQAMLAMESFVQAKTDAISLIEGCWIECELQRITVDDTEHFDVDPKLKGLIDAPLQLEFGQAAVVGEFVPGVRLALADFRSALRSPHDTGFYCYRALESLRQELRIQTNPELDEGQSWEQLRKVLDLNRSADIEPIKRLADGRRHGRPVPFSEADRHRSLSTTRVAIARFISWIAEANDIRTPSPPTRPR